MEPCGWRALEHTADEGLEVWAPSYEELLSVAARALFAVMGTPPAGLASEPVELVARGLDREDLLVRLLHEQSFLEEREGRLRVRAAGHSGAGALDFVGTGTCTPASCSRSCSCRRSRAA